jgi:hypothetical protein
MPSEYDGLSWSFARACREVDRERRNREKDYSPKSVLHWLEKDAPTATVEAVMFELREDGLDALKAPNCKRRIGDLSKRQLAEGLARLIKLRPRYSKISDDLLLYVEDLTK